MATLCPELALRIGLAARALPAVTPALLMPVLIDALQLPLTDRKLKSLTVQQLRSARRGALRRLPIAALETAIRYLADRAGVDIIDPTIPAPTPYRDGDLPGSVRVAIASNSGLDLDADFGRCARFLVYQVARDAALLVAVRGTAGDKGADDRVTWRVDLVRDCQLIFATSIGVRPAAKLVQNGAFLVRDPQLNTAADAVASIQRVLRSGPPPWLAKLVNLTPTTTHTAEWLPCAVPLTPPGQGLWVQ